MKIATSRYHESDLIRASGLTALAVSVSRPRWRLSYDLRGPLRDLAPHPAALRRFKSGEDDWETFARHYRDRLHQLGPARVCDRLAPYDPVVLLCWCPVDAPCHRRLLAAYLEVVMGQPVPELRR